MIEKNESIKNHSRRHYYPLVLTIVVGAVLSYAAFHMVGNWDTERIQAEFERRAHNRMTALQTGIDDHMEVFYSLREFYHASQYVDRGEFATFIDRGLNRLSGFNALEWIPRVPDSERAQYEEDAKAEGLEGFQFIEQNTDGLMVPAVQRDEYFPVYYVEPIEDNEAVLGFDLRTDPDMLEVMNEARDTGEAVATGRITFDREISEHIGFQVFMPIYRNKAPIHTVEERRENLAGFVSGIVRIDMLLEAAFANMDLGELGIHIHDESASGDERYLCEFEDGSPSVYSLDKSHDEKVLAGMHLMRSLNVGGREWSVLFHPTEDFLASQSTWKNWAVLVEGLLLTILIGLYLQVLASRAIHVERLVTVRTIALENEIVKATKAEKAINKKNKELLHTITERDEAVQSSIEAQDAALNLLQDSQIQADKLSKFNTELLELSKKRRELERIINLSPAIVFLRRADENWPVEFVSANIRQLGYSQEDLCSGRISFADMLHLEDLERVAAEIAQFCSEEGRESYTQEYRIVTPAGETRWIDDRTWIRRNDTGDITHFQGIIWDITDRKLAEERLRESEKRFQDMVECSTDWMWEINEKNEYTMASGKVKEVLGYDPEELIGKTPFDLMPEDESECVLEIFLNISSEKKPIVNLENWNLTKQGKRICLLTNGVPILDDEGNYLGYRGVDTDITDRKLAEEELRESEKKYRILLENLPQKIFQKDKDAVYVSCNYNYAGDLGIEPDEIAGKTDHDFFPREVADKYRADDMRIMESGVTEEIVEKYILDGQQLIVQTVKTPLKDENENVTGILAIFWDITNLKQAEEDLRKFKTISDSANYGTAIADMDGTLVYVNETWAGMHGYTPDELIGKHLSMLHPEDEMEHVNRLNEMIMLEGGYSAEEVRHVRRDGTAFPTLMNSSTIRDDKGNPMYLAATAIDITDHKQAEKALKENEEKLDAIVGSLTDHMSMMDEDLNIVWANGVARRLFGSDLIDKKCYSAYHGLDKPCKPCPVKDTFDDGKIHKHENEVLGVDGKEMNFWCISNVIARHEDGRPKTVIEISQNITDRVLAEQERARLATIIEQIAEIVVVTDIERNIEYVNPAFERVTGFKAEEVIHKSMRHYIAGEDTCTIWQEIVEAVDRGEKWSGRIPTKKKDGSVFIREVSLYPIRDSSGNVTSYVSVGRDVTEQMALESQLRHAQKLESIGQLAAGIAHEINTPTQYIGDNTRFLKEGFDDLSNLINKQRELNVAAIEGTVSSELMNQVKVAVEEADFDYLAEEIPRAIDQSLEGISRVSKIVRAMKEFSHPGTEEKATADINKAIESTVTVARNEWKYVAEMEMNFGDGLSMVPCHLGDLNQVVLNLVTNAAHAIDKKLGENSEEKGKITISTCRHGDCAEIRISDTGSGIPEEIRDRIFDPFFTTKDTGKGTGQGLAIAHSVIVDKHSGKITFETEDGVGTTFIIRIPIEETSEDCL